MFVALHTDMHSWVSMFHGQVHTLTVFRCDRLSFVLVLPLASALSTSNYTTSLNAPPRLLLYRFLLWLPITHSVKAPCSLLASRSQSCSRLRLCFLLRRAFWTVGP